MHTPKRQRTTAPHHSPIHHATPFRSPSPPDQASALSSSLNPANTSNSSNAPTISKHAGRRSPHNYPPSPLKYSTVPEGLFSSSVKTFPSHHLNRSWKSRVRYFLFQDTNARDEPPSTEHAAASSSRPPKRPVAPMLNYVQILTTPTADTPGTCLLVHHDNRRYLFGNVAEGTQRAFVQQKVSLSRADEVFLTGPIGWHTAGGLLGMVLTVADVVQAAAAAAVDEAKAKLAKAQKLRDAAAKTKSKDGKDNKNGAKAEEAYKAAVAGLAAAQAAPPRSLSIHGGINLTHVIATARRFIFRKGMPIRPHEVRHDTSLAGSASASSSDTVREPDWSDDNIMVWYVPVFADGADSNGRDSRKRALETSDDDTANESPTASSDRDAADRELVDSVVHHMFDSNWTLDALVETTLHAAKLPAKLFVKDEQGHLKEYDGPLPTGPGGAHVPDIPVLVRQPWPGALIESLPHTAPARQSMCYIVRNHPRRGKFDAAAAAKLGVAKQDNRHLVAGHSVTAADGRTVTPDMVIAADVEGAAFAVVELPDVSYIDAFLAKPEWAHPQVMRAIDTIFWLLGPGVLADARIQAFMQQHHKIRHTVASTDTCANRLALSSAAALQAKHHRVDPDRFPIQQYDNVEPTPAVPAASTGQSLFVPARPGWSVRLAPQVLEEDHKIYPYVDFAEALAEMDPQVLALADTARAHVATPGFQSAVDAGNAGLPHPDTEVIPLGTGSAMPSKYRNVSATLVRVPGVGSYLFDCGENTLGSMRRLFGAAKLREVLRDLKVLWISHLHADHHLGTVSVLKAWRDATAATASASEDTESNKGKTRRLMVASHVNMLQWLREYADVEDIGLDRIWQVALENHARDGPRSNVCVPKTFSPALQAEFGLERIDACRVQHCHGALACVFTWPAATATASATTTGGDRLKVAYSGDCRPSTDFAEIGQQATLLLHESTFDDELVAEARAKKHSTMGEALEVGRAMGARRVLLTHFSQRYPKIPVFASGENGENGGDDNNKNNSAAEMQVLVAFDQMQVRLRDFKPAAAYLPALQKLYEGEEMQGKKDKE
ncbi:tRNA processing endoribonuclease [Sporothrix brasiliensis 5110]|uniref:ribonuclease Z n=1 Tax=Sporothrix brasiliensis 5110 TaxID=1398154 RepID=A0A0C2FHK6_9PEZI|nr:tRNA processing endoribonuclease [Sporothrix brasiliensis 5110]KIH90563.1 tRNA processing endoribonuclease [Sporothrix brasiliensis 5110]